MKKIKITNSIDSLLADKLKKMNPTTKKSMLPFLIKAVGLIMALRILFGGDKEKKNKKVQTQAAKK